MQCNYEMACHRISANCLQKHCAVRSYKASPEANAEKLTRNINQMTASRLLNDIYYKRKENNTTPFEYAGEAFDVCSKRQRLPKRQHPCRKYLQTTIFGQTIIVYKWQKLGDNNAQLTTQALKTKRKQLPRTLCYYRKVN